MSYNYHFSSTKHIEVNFWVRNRKWLNENHVFWLNQNKKIKILIVRERNWIIREIKNVFFMNCIQFETNSYTIFVCDLHFFGAAVAFFYSFFRFSLFVNFSDRKILTTDLIWCNVCVDECDSTISSVDSEIIERKFTVNGQKTKTATKQCTQIIIFIVQTC